MNLINGRVFVKYMGSMSCFFFIRDGCFQHLKLAGKKRNWVFFSAIEEIFRRKKPWNLGVSLLGKNIR